MSNKNIKGYVLMPFVIALLITIVSFLYCRNLIAKKTLEEEFKEVEKEIVCELLGMVKIDEDISWPLKQFNVIDYYYKLNEIPSEKVVDYPVHKRLFGLEDQELFEKLYDVKIPIDLDYSKKYIYVTFGSEIDSFEIYRVHEDELSEWRPRAYDTIIHYKEPYDANYMYFYYISDEIYWLYDEDELNYE